MATKSEEGLRAFVEEESAPPQPESAKGPLASLLPTPASKNAPAVKTTGKGATTPASPKKAAGSPGASPGTPSSAALSDLQQSLANAGASLTEKVGGLETPGGIGLLLFALFVLLWMIVPVNGGHTRFGLLYLTLTGQTYLPDDSIPSATPTPTPGTGGGCPPGYLPDGKGGCIKTTIIEQSLPITAGGSTPFQGGAWPDFSGSNGFGSGVFIGV